MHKRLKAAAFGLFTLMFSVFGTSRTASAETSASAWATASGATFVPEMEDNVASFVTGGDFGTVSGYTILSIATAEAPSAEEALLLLGPSPARGNLVSAAVVHFDGKVGAGMVLLSKLETVVTTVPESTTSTTVSTTVPQTTVSTTVPKTTVSTTVPQTTVSTSVPQTTVSTTVNTSVPQNQSVRAEVTTRAVDTSAQREPLVDDATPDTTVETTVPMTGDTFSESGAGIEAQSASSTPTTSSMGATTIGVIALMCFLAAYFGAVLGRRR